MLTKLIISLLFIGPLCVAQPTIDLSKIGENEKVGRYADIRGFKMYYEIYGKGEPILFIHGNGGSIKNFINQVPDFSKRFRLILPDSRAQGKSIDTSDSLSYEIMADDLNALLDYLKIDSCYVVGWSDGGMNGLLLAMRHPNKVKKLAITGANLWPDTTAIKQWVHKALANTFDSLKRLPLTPKLKNELKVFRLMAEEPHIKINELKKINSPTLVIGGDQDIILPRHTMLIAESIPKAYLWIIPNSGHATHVIYKEEFNKTVIDFLIEPFRKRTNKFQDLD